MARLNPKWLLEEQLGKPQGAKTICTTIKVNLMVKQRGEGIDIGVVLRGPAIAVSGPLKRNSKQLRKPGKQWLDDRDD